MRFDASQRLTDSRFQASLSPQTQHAVETMLRNAETLGDTRSMFDDVVRRTALLFQEKHVKESLRSQELPETSEVVHTTRPSGPTDDPGHAIESDTSSSEVRESLEELWRGGLGGAVAHSIRLLIDLGLTKAEWVEKEYSRPGMQTLQALIVRIHAKSAGVHSGYWYGTRSSETKAVAPDLRRRQVPLVCWG